MPDGLDLAFDDAQEAIGSTLRQFCADRLPEEVVKARVGGLPREIWRELAELGVFGLATPDGEGGALELVAAVEALGGAVFPGPLAASCFAAQVLPPKERDRVVSGHAIVGVTDAAAPGCAALVPFATEADLFLEVADDRVFLAESDGGIEPVETLAGDPWGRVQLEREAELPEAGRALALSEIARAAYLAGAGQRLLDDAAEHARTRIQFGRAIGEFQAVAHPLADCAMQLSAAAVLARIAAAGFDTSESDPGPHAAAARLSAVRAALGAVYVCHQIFGAVGVTLEGPVFRVARRVRQFASEPPDEHGAREAVLELFGV